MYVSSAVRRRDIPSSTSSSSIEQEDDCYCDSLATEQQPVNRYQISSISIDNHERYPLNTVVKKVCIDNRLYLFDF